MTTNNSQHATDNSEGSDVLQSGQLEPHSDNTGQKDDQDMDIYPEDNKVKYSTDAQGNILAPLKAFDCTEVCNLLRKKTDQPPEKWIRKVKDGLIVYFGAPKSAARKKIVPEFLSFLDCIDVVSMSILNHFEIFPPAGKILEDPIKEIEKQIPSESDLKYYAWSIKILSILQRLCPKPQRLLPNSHSTRVIIRYISIRIMTESMAFLENIAVKNISSPVEEEFALQAFLSACGLLNQFLEGDLEGSGVFARALATMPPQDPIPIYPYLWVNTLYLNCYSSRCLSWLTQSVIIAQKFNINNENKNNSAGEGEDSMDIDTPAENSNSHIGLLYWRCIDSSATFFFSCCFIHQFVKVLVANPHCEQLLLAIEKILQITTNGSPHILRAKFYLLRVLVVLAENDEPYFLDYASKMKTSYTVAQLVAREASQILQLVSTVKVVDEDIENPTPALVAREALRVAELLSYDSNFVKLVTENLTLFILEYLSAPPNIFSSYFEVEGSFPQYITALVFRMIANLHCYNPAVSPPDQKHFLINKVHHYFTTILVATPEGEIRCTSRIIIGNIATNLWILFQRVTELFSFTLQELELWRSFMGELQKELNLLFPPPHQAGANTKRTPVAQPKPRAPRPVDDEYFTESDADEEIEDDADEFEMAPAVKPDTLRSALPTDPAEFPMDLTGPSTTILKGLSVCFAVVPNPEGLKALVKHHGGSVIGYVTKSVTHVICGHDLSSVDASQSKVQSAAAKQVPVVTEKLIHDSIKEGRILNERPYLVASHSYLRRVKC